MLPADALVRALLRALCALDLYAQRADVVLTAANALVRSTSDHFLQQAMHWVQASSPSLRPHVSEALHVSDCGIDSSMLVICSTKGYEILSSASAGQRLTINSD
jgi:hypothetical protein